MAFDVSSLVTEEDERDLEDIVNGNGTPTTQYLSELRSLSIPAVNFIAGILLESHGLRSDVSLKRAETAEEKCRRPETMRKYSWFTLAHIRDFLRFRTYLDRASDFESVLIEFASLQASGVVNIVKIDTEKLIRPGIFGWRMMATDLRIMQTGLIVEHYMTFGNMIEVNERWLHKVYETWRSKAIDQMTLREIASLQRDARFSRHSYRELLFDGILKEQAMAQLRTNRDELDDMIIASLKNMLHLA
jgi:hypothetical protein